jgi:drug/metabolite transporter (DMT)-like permease
MLGEAAALGAAACWALGSVLFERVGKAQVSAGAINLAKCWLGAGVLLGATWAVRGRPWPSGVSERELGLLVGSAVLGLAVGDTAFFASLRRLGASRALLLLSMAPVFVALMEAGAGGRLPPRSDLAGMGLALGGLALVLWKPADGSFSWAGAGWGLVAALGQAGGSWLSREAMQGAMDPLSASWFRLLIGALGVALAGAVGGQLGGWRRELQAPGVLGGISQAALVGTVLGLFLMQVGLALSRSGGVASALTSLSPIFSLLLARWLSAEPVTRRALGGALLAVSGVLVLLL